MTVGSAGAVVDPGRFRLLAGALARRPLGVTAAAFDAPHTDGVHIFVSGDAPLDEQRRQVLVQAALLGGGSLEPSLVKTLRGRPKVARRYLALEGRRVLADLAGRVPLADELSARGSRLILLARPSPELDQVALRTGAVSLAVDLSDHGALDGVIAKAEAANGAVDAIVNNAAMTTGGPFHELTAEQLRASVTTNLISHMELDRQALAGMVERGRGLVQVVGSLSAEISMIRLAAYAPAKAGLAKFGLDSSASSRTSGSVSRSSSSGPSPGPRSHARSSTIP